MVDQLPLEILIPALLAGLLVLSTHVPFGLEVLRRGIIFIDLAIAQVAGLGVIAAHSFGWNPHGWKVQLFAVMAALTGAAILAWTEKRWPLVQEAIIGTMFVVAASLGILLLANNPHGGDHLQDLLSGQILWVRLPTLLPVLLLYSAVLLFWFRFRERMRGAGFYVLFALIVTASVQLVGIYLVFASLIIPALGVRVYPEKYRPILAYVIGLAGFTFGLFFSAWFDLPSGALITLMLAVVAILASLSGRILISVR